MYHQSRSRGFIKFVILVIIALALLKYFFNLSFKDIVDNDVVRDIWTIFKSLLKIIWDTLLLLLDFLKELIATAKEFVAGLKSN